MVMNWVQVVYYADLFTGILSFYTVYTVANSSDRPSSMFLLAPLPSTPITPTTTGMHQSSHSSLVSSSVERHDRAWSEVEAGGRAHDE